MWGAAPGVDLTPWEGPWAGDVPEGQVGKEGARQQDAQTPWRGAGGALLPITLLLGLPGKEDGAWLWPHAGQGSENLSPSFVTCSIMALRYLLNYGQRAPLQALTPARFSLRRD